METIGSQYQSADWKAEKHIPVIECPDKVTVEDVFDITVSIGKEIAHPNTTEHHIRWVRLYFKPEGDKFAYEVANVEFSAHGESAEGANAGPAYTHHMARVSLQVKRAGTLYATSLCNIHGLWESSKAISL